VSNVQQLDENNVSHEEILWTAHNNTCMRVVHFLRWELTISLPQKHRKITGCSCRIHAGGFTEPGPPADKDPCRPSLQGITILVNWTRRTEQDSAGMCTAAGVYTLDCVSKIYLFLYSL